MRKNKQLLKKIVDDNFLILTYRKKYNLPLNDVRYTSLTLEEIYNDLMINKIYEEEIKEIEESDDEDYDDIEDLKEMDGKSKVALKSGFSKEEIDNWFNEE